MTGSVVVIGAINVDLVVSGAPLPAPGQTVTGGVFAQHHGGKGGNQAVAASRALGGHGVVLVGAVGKGKGVLPVGASWGPSGTTRSGMTRWRRCGQRVWRHPSRCDPACRPAWR